MNRIPGISFIAAAFVLGAALTPARAQSVGAPSGVETRAAPEASNTGQVFMEARLAAQKGDYAKAEQNYARVYGADPSRDDALLVLAKVQSWQGKLDEAAAHYRAYLARHPKDRDALLNYAYAQAWRGDHADALELLDAYRAAGGDAKEYATARARFLAYAGRTDEALALTDTALRANPHDRDALFSRTIALREGRRLQLADDTLRQIDTSSKDGRDLALSVQTPLRSSVEAGAVVSSDTDSVRIVTETLQGNVVVNPRLVLKAGALTEQLSADKGTGLETKTGGAHLDRETGWAGVEYAATDWLWLQGRVGEATSDKTDGTGIYRAGAEYRPVDSLVLDATVDRDFHAVSPRAVSLDITRTDNQLQASWRPNLLYTVDANAGYAFFSDGNERWNASLAPRRSILRREGYNLDLGVSARWFGFNKKPGNGYYSPATYEQYLLMSYSYFKLSEQDGISLVAAPGVQRDETLGSYKFSGNLAVEGTFGLYRDWMLKCHAGIVDNIGVSGGAYVRREAGLALTRRF